MTFLLQLYELFLFCTVFEFTWQSLARLSEKIHFFWHFSIQKINRIPYLSSYLLLTPSEWALHWIWEWLIIAIKIQFKMIVFLFILINSQRRFLDSIIEWRLTISLMVVKRSFSYWNRFLTTLDWMSKLII